MNIIKLRTIAKAIRDRMLMADADNIEVSWGGSDTDLEALKPYFKSIKKEPFGYVRFELSK